MINLDKLACIEEQHASVLDGVRSVHSRYLARALSARNKCRRAIASAADTRIQCLSLNRLADYTNDQLAAYGVDMELLDSARREQQVVIKLLAEWETRQVEALASAKLMRALRVHAGTQNEEGDTLCITN